MADNYIEKREAELRERKPKVKRVNKSIDTLLRSSRSYRGYGPAPVTEEQLRAIVGVYRYVPSGMNAQPLRFRLVSSTTNGVFSWTGDDPIDICWNVGAIYPKFDNSISWNTTNEKHYANVEIKAAYDYTAGQVFMPMVANMSSESSQPTGVNFKHVAVAVKVTLNDLDKLPSEVELAKVSITADQTISGWCNMAIPDAGTKTGVLAANGGDDGSSKTVAFNIKSSDDIASSMTFYFPIRHHRRPYIILKSY